MNEQVLIAAFITFAILFTYATKKSKMSSKAFMYAAIVFCSGVCTGVMYTMYNILTLIKTVL